MGTGEANFLGGVASVKEVTGFDRDKATKRFFEIYLDKNAKPNSGIVFPEHLGLSCSARIVGLRWLVASSADRVKVDANLAAAGLPISICLDLNEEEPVLSTLELKGVQPPSSKPKSLKLLGRWLSADTKMVTANGGSSSEGYLYLAISVPDGYHFSKEAQSKFDVEVDPTEAVNIEPSNGVMNSKYLHRFISRELPPRLQQGE